MKLINLILLLDKNRWDAFVKLSSILMAGVFLYISSQFSVSGFGIEVHNKKWIGWMLAFGLIVLELIWNRMMKEFGSNIREFPILFVAGIVGYVYGIYTNILGINHLAGIDITNLQMFKDVFVNQPIQTSVGIMVEIIPEGMLVWALSQKVKALEPIKQPQQQPKPQGQQYKGYHGVRPEFQQKIQNKNRPQNFKNLFEFETEKPKEE